MAKPIRHRERWRIRWVDHLGRRRSAVYDDYKVALYELRQREIEAEDVRRGGRSAPVEPKTFQDAAKYWEEKRAPLKRSQHHDISILKQLRAHFGALLLNDQEGWVYALDDYKIVKTKRISKKTLANHLTLLGSILRVAVDLGWMLRLPKIQKPKIDIASETFGYLRTDDEIRRFLRAAQEEGEHVHALYTTALFTGMRAGELAGLGWEDVNFERRLITVVRSFEGPTKSDKPRHVPILDPLLPVLRAWRLRHPGTLVFTNRDGRMLQPSSRVFQEVLHRVLARAGFPAPPEGSRKRGHIRFHDLRHTFASLWMVRGGDLFRLRKVLGHASVTMTERYSHLAPEVFVEDHARFGKDLVLSEGEVVTLPLELAVRRD